MMDEPSGPPDAWSNISAGAEGVSPIHRPTSAPPVMELTQQLNAAELAHQGFLPMDAAYFGVSSEASNARDPSGAFFGDHSNHLYLNGNGNQDDFMTGTHSEASRGPTGTADNYGPSAGAHHPYPQHMMPGAHSHMSHFAMHQGGPQAMNMASNGMPYFGMPNPTHMAGYHGPMPQAYGFQGYVPGPTGQTAAHVPPEMVYRQGAVPAGYFGYSHFQPPESHMYGYNGPMAPTSAQQPGRAHSVGGEDTAKTVAYGMHAVPRVGYNYSHNMGLSASPPNEPMNWNKSSPRGGKRVGAKGKSSTEVSLSSSTEDLLSLAGKPHLIKDLGPSGSMEFSGSMTELPIMGGPSPGPHSPRSPQNARKHIKVQQRSANGNFKPAPGAGSGNDATAHVGGASRGANGANNSANGSHPMPIGWSGAGNTNGDEINGLFAGVNLNGSSAVQPVSAIPINSTVVHPEFVMGSGSPILARMHHPAAANGNAAPGSNTASNGQICHYHTMGLCGKGDKCRYTHSEDGNSGRRTPRAPVVSPVSFGSDTAPTNTNNGNMHIQQAVPVNHHAMALNNAAPLILSQSPSANMNSVPTSSIGQAPLLPPMNSLLGGSSLVGANNAVGNGSAPGAVGGQAATAATAAGNNANNTQALASMRYSNVTLEECVGQIFQMCKDQYGCRFLQKKLDEDKTSTTCDIIFGEILPEVVELMSDPFGNYLCQKLIEKCSASQRLAVVRGVSGSLVQISKNMHGTRAVQKTIEQLGSPEEVRLIREALKGSVVALIQDLNGNHVIQKCIHRLEPNDNQFIYDAVAHHCVQVATHRHGCCVMQRCIDHSSNQQKMQLIEEIKNNALSLVQDQFGNYVVQYVLDLGMESVCESLATNLLGHLYFLSTQKFSSNVVEKCLKVGNAATVQMMSRELAEFQTDPANPVFPQTPHEDPLICLLQHPFGNYVVQTALQVAQIKAPKEWNAIATRIRPLLPTLRSNTYVKRVQGLLLQANAKMAAEAGIDVLNQNPNDEASLAMTEPLTLSNELLTDVSQASIAHSPNGTMANPPNLIQQNGHSHNHHPQHHHNNHHHGPRSHGTNRVQGGGRSHHGKEHANTRSSYEQRRQH